MLEILETLPTRGFTDSQKEATTEEPLRERNTSDYWYLAERRKSCRSPKGLKLEDSEDHREYAIVRCQLCASCREWAMELDAVRIAEAIEHPVYFEVPDDVYESARQRIKNAGGSYYSAPLAHERRGVICDREHAPAGKRVEDLGAKLAKLDSERDRTEGRNARRVATSRMESRKSLERKALATDNADSAAEKPRKVVGMFNPRPFLELRRPLSEAGDWLAEMAASLGVPAERTELGVSVPTTYAHLLDAELDTVKGRARWRTDEPPPEVYDQLALIELEESDKYTEVYLEQWEQFRDRLGSDRYAEWEAA